MGLKGTFLRKTFVERRYRCVAVDMLIRTRPYVIEDIYYWILLMVDGWILLILLDGVEGHKHLFQIFIWHFLCHKLANFPAFS